MTVQHLPEIDKIIADLEGMLKHLDHHRTLGVFIFKLFQLDLSESQRPHIDILWDSLQ